jgi:murein DD-endopeptidase MepM/ murein hydrolase activator NlpD
VFNALRRDSKALVHIKRAPQITRLSRFLFGVVLLASQSTPTVFAAPGSGVVRATLARSHSVTLHESIPTEAALVYPVMGPRMSSDYGMRKHPRLRTKRHHHGIDLAAPEGAAIRAIAPGTVIFADPYGGYGNLVVVKHDDGKRTSHYGHCKVIKVQTGERVSAGKILALVGSTGISTGPHLHFEIRENGTPQNPEELLPGLAAASAG